MLTESEVLDVLERSMAPGGVLLRQVRSHRADGGPERTIDAVHVGLSPARGYTVTAYEVKRSRQDLRTELANVDKGEWWGQAADAFYLVVTDRAIVDGLPIPPAWGVLSVSAHGVREEKPADMDWFGPRHQHLPRNLMAALVDAARRTAPMPAGDVDRSNLMDLAAQAARWDREKAERNLRVQTEIADAWRHRIAYLLGIEEMDAERVVLEAHDHGWTEGIRDVLTGARTVADADHARTNAIRALRDAADALENPGVDAP